MNSVPSKILVEQELKNLGIQYLNMEHGSVEIMGQLSNEQKESFSKRLVQLDLSLLEDNKSILTEKVKSAIYEMICLCNELPKINYSNYLNEKLGYDYTYMANVFIEMTGFTIREFIINYRIEKVKELIQRDELNLTEISNKLNYSSAGHLSNQFKKVTGVTPSDYKKLQFRTLNLVDEETTRFETHFFKEGIRAISK